MQIKKELCRWFLASMKMIHLVNFLPDRLFLSLLFRRTTGTKLELNPPRTFNQKLQWIKLYDRNPQYTVLVDKYRVKEYVSNKIGESYVVPLLGVWDKPEEIAWDKLPNQFVLKTNHDSGGIVICKDKNLLDKQATLKILNKSLSHDYWKVGREWPYKGINRKIIAESYLKEDGQENLRDYKVMCFNGNAKIIEYHEDRFSSNHVQAFYDSQWNLLPFNQKSYRKVSLRQSEKPSLLNEMIQNSEILSAGIPHVRVDWYIVENKLYFGEMTFFDSSGFDDFEPYEYNNILGDWINLPNKNL